MSLFFFCQNVLEVERERWDDEFHWGMCSSAQNIKHCDNCKFFDNYDNVSLRDPLKYICRKTGKTTKPFMSCIHFFSPSGAKRGFTNSKKMYLYPRESLKTWVLAAGKSIWTWCKDLDYTYLLLMQNESKAKETIGLIKELIEKSPKLRKYYPEFIEAYETNTKKDQWSMKFNRPDHRKRDASFLIASIGSGLESGHFDEIVYDDIIGADHVNSTKEMDNAEDNFMKTIPLTVQRRRKQTYIATIQAKDDVTDKQRKTGSWHVERHELFYIAMTDDDIKNPAVKSVIEIKGQQYRQATLDDCKRYLEDGYISDTLYVPFTQWWLEEDGKPTTILETIKECAASKEKGWNYYFCQYHNRPHGIPSRGFSTDWFKNYTEDSIVKKYYPALEEYGAPPWFAMNTYINLDLATGAKGRGNSDTAFTVWSIDFNPMHYLRESFSEKISIKEAVDKLFDLHEKYPDNKCVTIEQGALLHAMMSYYNDKLRQKQLEAQLRNEEYTEPNIIPIPRTQRGAIEKKEDRIIAALQPLYEDKKVIHVGDEYAHTNYENQLAIVGEPGDRKLIDAPDAGSDMVLVKEVPDAEWAKGMILERCGQPKENEEQREGVARWSRMCEEDARRLEPETPEYDASDIWT